MTSLPLSRLQKRLLVAITVVLTFFAVRTGADTLGRVGRHAHFADAPGPHHGRHHGHHARHAHHGPPAPPVPPVPPAPPAPPMPS